MKTQELPLTECLESATNTVGLLFRHLCISFFYAELSKRIQFERIVSSIEVYTGDNHYILHQDMIKETLRLIYDRPHDVDPFSSVALVHVVRGIASALREAVKNSTLEAALVHHVLHDRDHYQHFKAALLFIRNVLTHAFTSNVIILDDYIERDRKAWEKTHHGSPIRFRYDYAPPLSKIQLPGAKKRGVCVDIRIDWESITTGLTKYTDVVSVFQTFLFAEFCHNALNYLTHLCRQGQLQTPP